jgi:hypothetical protein
MAEWMTKFLSLWRISKRRKPEEVDARGDCAQVPRALSLGLDTRLLRVAQNLCAFFVPLPREDLWVFQQVTREGRRFRVFRPTAIP